jgi:hypothetical protein
VWSVNMASSTDRRVHVSAEELAQVVGVLSVQ